MQCDLRNTLWFLEGLENVPGPFSLSLVFILVNYVLCNSFGVGVFCVFVWFLFSCGFMRQSLPIALALNLLAL